MKWYYVVFGGLAYMIYRKNQANKEAKRVADEAAFVAAGGTPAGGSVSPVM